MSTNLKHSLTLKPSNLGSVWSVEDEKLGSGSVTVQTSSSPTTDSGLSSKETSTPETGPSSSPSRKSIQTLISDWSSSRTTSSLKTATPVTPSGPESTDSPSTWVGTCPSNGSPLKKALDIVYGDRGVDYGHPSEDFARTAKMWSAIFGVEVPIWKVPLAMIAVKISREINQQKEDNLVDIAGYTETLRMTYQKEVRK